MSSSGSTTTSPNIGDATSDQGGNRQHGLDELRLAVDRLWQAEPQAAPSTRSRLLEQLARLDHEIERLMLRLHSGELVDDQAVQNCARKFDELSWWWRSESDRQLSA